MTDKVLVNNAKSTSADTVEIFFTSDSNESGTIITAFSAINATNVNASYIAYIYDSASTTDSQNPAIPLTKVVRKRFDLGASIINQVIPAGGTLRMESSAANSISFRVSGRDQA
jgi:hypothetical protein